MAAVAAAERAMNDSNGFNNQNNNEDPFLENGHTGHHSQPYRFSSRYEHDTADLAITSSPSQAKRVLEAHLLETERRLQDAQKLGTSLLLQQSELQDKLREVEQQQDETVISPELKQRLVSIGREHDDVSREIARSLLAPKSRVVSADEKTFTESTTLTSQATGSPTKISAPSRRQRNQPTSRAGDLQFAADISTSLLAQVRQLQAAVAERDDTIKSANSERSKLEQDNQFFAQRLRSHDENEQRYKDEIWNLEAQNHTLLAGQREWVDKEKRLNTTVTIANAEKTRLIGEMEEVKLAHSKLSEDHSASKKAHETELHSMKRDFDVADAEKLSLQSKIDELTSQNQELAKAMASRYRSQSPVKRVPSGSDENELIKDLSTPEHSPPPSPTKATPRHGGLESETLKSSLHHAHRMIQNLKGNIHREKTEKIELKRMLQEARDELEQRRNDSGLSSGSKKQKTRNDIFKKPARPDMLGNSRRARTDVELQDDDWEDQANDSPGLAGRPRTTAAMTDFSDAYQTAHETESNFETADERNTTESEAFETGAESLAGDSTDDLTETESTAPRAQPRALTKQNRPSLAFKHAGDRTSYRSTASTSGGEDDEDQSYTPIQSQPSKFKLRNGRSFVRQTQIHESTPESVRTRLASDDSPATVTDGRSPPPAEQSLFAELEGINDTSSNFSTPARSGIVDMSSPQSASHAPSRAILVQGPPLPPVKPVMVDSSMMTESPKPEPQRDSRSHVANPAYVSMQTMTDTPAERAGTHEARAPSIGDFPLPPSIPTSPAPRVDNSTQYTPQRYYQLATHNTSHQPSETGAQYTPSKSLQDSPARGSTFITPPKTVWDEEHESERGSPEQFMQKPVDIPRRPLAYSGMLTQETMPKSPPPAMAMPAALAFSTIVSQQTWPIAPPMSPPPTSPLPQIPTAAKQERPPTSEKAATGATAGGILAGAAAVLGFGRSKDATSGAAVEKTATSEVATTQDQAAEDLFGTSGLREQNSIQDANLKQAPSPLVPQSDQGSQTMLTSQQIEQALQPKRNVLSPPIVMASDSEASPLVPPRSPNRSANNVETPMIAFAPAPASPPLRPSSSASYRASTSASKQHPPLPSDYKTNIARANSMAHNGALKRENSIQAAGIVMGPPLMPASAMRRPKTPSESVRSPGRENATPRLSNTARNQRSVAGSQISRRSSVSSFASELDERFNIRAENVANGYEPAPGTDPRMIQAITQTMIGEYLWKYTRKTGSKDMSNTRHRRYFWVHPYTKTLYWSTTDPSIPGAKEGKSRSVPIESIRVVSDDNPMPPGLHRKSLEITAPGRKLKVTAQTGQRHETWFNALSYLLLRGEPPDAAGAYATGGNEITRDDIDEFRVSGYNPHLTTNTSRISMSSYNSRTTAGTSKRVSGATVQRQSLPSNMVSENSGKFQQRSSSIRNSSVPPTADSSRLSRVDQPREMDKDRTIRANSLSRVSRMLGSITGRSSGQNTPEISEVRQGKSREVTNGESSSIYNASVVSATRDSAEEARQEMLRNEASGLGPDGGLENVRACCDGKHDVSNLNHNHHTHDRHRALSSMSDRINRSMSKRV